MRWDKKREKLSDLPLEGWWDRTEACLNDAVNQGLSTETLYGDHFNSRASIHRDILDEYIELALQHPLESKGMIIGGLPASGKSTYLSTHCKDYAVVSPDFFKEVLIDRELVPDVDITPLETGSLCHAESAWLAKKYFFELIELGVNVALDFTMNYPDSVVGRVKSMKGKGYFTEAILLKITKKTSIERARYRHTKGVVEFLEDGEGLGGRFVPISYIKGCTPQECFNYTKHYFHKSYVYDTAGDKPVLEYSW